jgi:hypothetical protein
LNSNKNRKKNIKMIEQILDLVKQFGADTVINNPQIPNEKNNEVLADATQTITGGLQNILSLFSNGATNQSSIIQNPIVNMMVGHFINKLMAKYGLQGSAASSIATSLIPSVLNGLISKTADPNDNSIDMNSIISSLTGGKTPVAQQNSGGSGFDFQALLEQFIGNNQTPQNVQQNTQQQGGLQDIISAITGGAQQQQETQAQSGGGIMDIIKMFAR